ncbi:HemK family protein methyltransferase [Cumulibacter manganitolerans]|uniref:HemK family protein methyltransferase n=1 Tax=Cumulibacter manganitolerans TaxID=1884992 RepID=UPI001297ED05|nr:HemK family protein methyltransferase [Cumulibacter manganitolerans]
MGPEEDERAHIIPRLRAAGCVYAEQEAALLCDAAPDREALALLVERRVAGEPLEHVLGHVRFCGLQLVVRPGVFVPRQRTALLVEHVARGLPADGVLADLCTGVGAVAAAVRVARPEARIFAADVDPAAIACAEVNLPGAWVGIAELFTGLPAELAGRIDVVSANAPYIPDAELALLPREARSYEPARALLGGADGLALHRRIVAELGAWLRPGGCAVLEVSPRQWPRVADLAHRHGYAVEFRQDGDGGQVAVLRAARSKAPASSSAKPAAL